MEEDKGIWKKMGEGKMANQNQDIIEKSIKKPTFYNLSLKKYKRKELSCNARQGCS